MLCCAATSFAGTGILYMAGQPTLNCTHYKVQAGTTATAQIVNATDVDQYAVNGMVTVTVKSSEFGNTEVQGTVEGTTITFSWTAPLSGCNTTIVAYGANGNNAQPDSIGA